MSQRYRTYFAGAGDGVEFQRGLFETVVFCAGHKGSEVEEAEGENEQEHRRRSQTLDPSLQFFSTFF